MSESPSSVAMELIGYERGLDKLRYLGVPVGLIATDRSPSIKKLMKTDRYQSVLHQFDAWHVGKGRLRIYMHLLKMQYQQRNHCLCGDQ